MAKCPKCNHKLRVIDWKPECPNCGVNVIYYDFEKQFYIDAKHAELDAAKIRVKWARVKAAFIGNRLLVARLSLCLAPLLAALLPFGRIRFAIPLFEKNLPVSLIGLYSFFTDGSLDYFGALKATNILGTNAAQALRVMFGLTAVAGIAFAIFALQLLCFISFRKMSLLMAGASLLGIAAAAWTVAQMLRFSAAPLDGLFTANTLYGGYAVVLMFGVLAALNFAIAKKGIEIRYKEGDLYRVEIARKLKRKELTLDDIPQPVYQPAGSGGQEQRQESGEQGGEGNG
ncbi:MAG TPA: hypothetical protein PL044_07990 [Clostridiales bacterium]|mgnify:CR=1 FL=1|nr:MAG: hypothetical protein BWY37_02008 [Firmicutes bacterium ADurb.Bin262]HOU09111.1 hypothetical protein [Clostridiales bacterium]HQK73693.1 hypothetical protein [Clostridiales bacterium]